jgi:hypothetical protein
MKDEGWENDASILHLHPSSLILHPFLHLLAVIAFARLICISLKR